MSAHSPLYLGFDLSTQQLKVLAVTSDLKVVHEAKFDFDAESKGYKVRKGVLTNDDEHEVYAPVAMWLQALDGVLDRLKDQSMDFERVKGISGAGQQHGSVYWSEYGEHALENLDHAKPLESQMDRAFSYPNSPNWQDASTQQECAAFDQHLGSEEQLAFETGSKAHHRFTGPQILRFRRKHTREYERTSRISLVSSFLASIFLGKIAPIDISDVCGMNLWDINAGEWSERLLSLTAGSLEPRDLIKKLGEVPKDGGAHLGRISSYFVKRYNFDSSCIITPFTGDNPATILSLPLRSGDAIVSLGTSTTFLMSTPSYKPHPSVHFMNHPTTPGLYMFMLCYKNGGLARERIRDSLPTPSWSNFNHHALHTPILGVATPTYPMKLALYFPRPEIVPNIRAGTYRYTYTPSTKALSRPAPWPATTDARLILESQFLSLRLRSRDLVTSSNPTLPPQPHRIYLVGGASLNPAIAAIAGQVLGGEGVYTLDVGENACALGAAYKAVWAVERGRGEAFEALVGGRWDERGARRVAGGYERGIWESYGVGVEGLGAVERDVLGSEGV